MLYDPARHEALTDTAWDDARARATLEAIAADVDASFDEQALWPKHPLVAAMTGGANFEADPAKSTRGPGVHRAAVP